MAPSHRTVFKTSSLCTCLCLKCIDKVVRRPGALNARLAGFVRKKVSCGKAKGFHGAARYKEIEGQEATAP